MPDIDVNDLLVIFLVACLAVQVLGVFLIIGLIDRLHDIVMSMPVIRRADGFGASDAQPWES